MYKEIGPIVTVKQWIEALSKLPPDTKIIISNKFRSIIMTYYAKEKTIVLT